LEFQANPSFEGLEEVFVEERVSEACKYTKEIVT
jgi:hypothetical protein